MIRIFVLCVSILTLQACNKQKVKDITITCNVSSETLEFEAAGGSQTVSITSNSTKWVIRYDSDWYTVVPDSSAWNDVITITAKSNDKPEKRTSQLRVDVPGMADPKILITQLGNPQ